MILVIKVYRYDFYSHSFPSYVFSGGPSFFGIWTSVLPFNFVKFTLDTGTTTVQIVLFNLCLVTFLVRPILLFRCYGCFNFWGFISHSFLYCLIFVTLGCAHLLTMILVRRYAGITGSELDSSADSTLLSTDDVAVMISISTIAVGIRDLDRPSPSLATYF